MSRLLATAPRRLEQLRQTATLDVVVNAVFFNVSWFVIVITQSALVGAAQAAAHLLVHFWLIGRVALEWRLILGVTLFGLGLDQLLFATGVFTVQGAAALAPVWLSCLWPVFATTLMHAFRPLQGRHLLSAILGGVGGAGSYVAGARLTAVDFGDPVVGPLLLGVLWAALFPLLLAIAARLERSHAPQ